MKLVDDLWIGDGYVIKEWWLERGKVMLWDESYTFYILFGELGQLFIIVISILAQFIGKMKHRLKKNEKKRKVRKKEIKTRANMQNKSHLSEE